MLGRRLISAAVIISVTILLLCIDFWLGTGKVGRPGLVVCLLSTVAAAMAASELVAMLANVTNRVNQNFAVGATVVMLLVTCAPVWWREYPVDCALGRFGWGLSGFVLAIVMTLAYEMFIYRAPIGGSGKGEVTDRLGRYALVFAYVIMCFGFLVPHRFYQGNGYGILALVTLIATVKLSDSFAYFAGKRFGTIKLAPQLSPGKTLQGSLAAPVGGCIAAAICLFVVAPAIFDITVQKPWWWFLVYGILVTAAGMMGDLAESLIKRDCNTKDSSSWLPGLGGVLDILDSMVFAAPVSYFLWIIAELPAQTLN